MICVYKITNPIGQVYIGSTINYKKRPYYYRSISSKKQVKIYNSIQKFGWDNHKMEVLEVCTKETMWERERYYGLLFDVLSENGLNRVLPKSKGEKAIFSDEMKLNMKNRNGGYIGHPHTEQSKKLLSIAQIGRKHTIEHRMKVSLNNAKINSKLVIDLETGIFYDSIKDAAIAKGIVHSTLKSRINGRSPTKTLIAYA